MRASSSSFTKPSLEHLNTVADFFAEAAPTCPAAASHLVNLATDLPNNHLTHHPLKELIRTLRSAAHEAFDQTRPRVLSPSLTPIDLDRLCGMTHLIWGSASISPSINPESASASHSESPRHLLPDTSDHLHPQIVSDMKVFYGIEGEPPQSIRDIYDFLSDSHDLGMPDVGLPDATTFNLDNDSRQPTPKLRSGSHGPGYAQSAISSGASPLILDATLQSFAEQLGFTGVTHIGGELQLYSCYS